MDDEVNCTCFNNYTPVGNGSDCGSKYMRVCRETHAFFLLKPHLAKTFAVNIVFGGATAVITDSIGPSSSYTACGLVGFASTNGQILEILGSGKTSLTSGSKVKGSIKLLALVPTH